MMTGARRVGWLGLTAVIGLLLLGGGARASGLPCGLLQACPAPTPPSAPGPAPQPAPTPVSPAPGLESSAFDGHIGTRDYASLTLASGGGRVAHFEFLFFKGRCGDGTHYQSDIGADIHTGATLNSVGHASYARRFGRAYTYNHNGTRVDGVERVRFSVTVSGDTAQGTFVDTFTSRKLKCSSRQVPFVAYRDGTNNAPLSNPAVASGLYKGKSTDQPRGRLKPQSLQLHVFLPWNAIQEIHFFWHLSCQKGDSLKRYRITTQLWMVPLRMQDGVETFARQQHGVIRYRNGSSDHYTNSLTGQFSGGSSDRVTGAFTETDNYYRGALYLGSCSGQAVLQGTSHGA